MLKTLWKEHSRILLPAGIRLCAGVGGAGLLLYLASKAAERPGLATFIYIQHSAIVVATFAKLGVDTIIQTDASRAFRLGPWGAAVLLSALLIGSGLMVGADRFTLWLAVFSVALLTTQNAVLVALATRDGAYMRGAIETAWTLPALLVFVILRSEKITEIQIAGCAFLLFATRLSSSLTGLFRGRVELGPLFRGMSQVWLFQVMNLLLFRLDQTLLSFLANRGLHLQHAAACIFWAKTNDLCNAVSTAIGGLANREEQATRLSRKPAVALRFLYPFGCLTLYALVAFIFPEQLVGAPLLLPLASLVSAAMSFEINRRAYQLLWKQEYGRLLAIWLFALLVGSLIAIAAWIRHSVLGMTAGVSVQLLTVTIFTYYYERQASRPAKFIP